MNGAERIAAERQRQIEVEGYDPERDEDPRQLAAAAAAYLLVAAGRWLEARVVWPWPMEFFKPYDFARDVERGGALAAAALDGHDRLAPATVLREVHGGEKVGIEREAGVTADRVYVADLIRAASEPRYAHESQTAALVKACHAANIYSPVDLNHALSRRSEREGCTHHCEEGHFTGDDMVMCEVDAFARGQRYEQALAAIEGGR